MKRTFLTFVVCIASMTSSATFAGTYTLKDVAQNKLGVLLSTSAELSKQIELTLASSDTQKRLMLDKEICAEAGSMNANAAILSTLSMMHGIDEASITDIGRLNLLTSGITNRFCSYRVDSKRDYEVEKGDYQGLVQQLQHIKIIADRIDSQLPQ